jgi:YbgC/YbaW family acyl-CoA thioester hydrolase
MTPFSISRRVEFGDTDMAGIMHFATFFRFMEVAETDFLHSLGLSVCWRDAGVKWGFPRISAACDYQRPARFEDVLTIAVIVAKVGARSVNYRFEFTNQNGESIAIGRITTVYCRHPTAGALESVDIPNDIRSKLEACL